jgi:K+-transporting ATPase ATPase C chain
MKQLVRPAVSLFVVLSVLTGLIYPFVVTGLGSLLFARQAAGSLLQRNGLVVGSTLIGQNFTDPGHFWGRLSATSPQPNNGLASGGSNLGPENPALIDAVKARIDALHQADPDNSRPIPIDLATASASGLDPDISPAAASYQATRVAHRRGIPVERVQALIAEHTAGRQWGMLGEARVNVLQLNLALEDLH